MSFLPCRVIFMIKSKQGCQLPAGNQPRSCVMLYKLYIPMTIKLFISATLSELSLSLNNGDTNLATHWPSWINAALCSQAEHLSVLCFGLQCQPKAPSTTWCNSFLPPGIWKCISIYTLAICQQVHPYCRGQETTVQLKWPRWPYTIRPW